MQRQVRKKGAVAFFPWFWVNEPVRVGPLTLLPFLRGRLPGNTLRISQAEIDGLLRAYADRRTQRVQKATIVEVARWKTGSDANRSLSKLFMGREALTFAALAERRLFCRHFGYWNADTFSLVVQRCSAGDAKGVTFTTRRRDGGTHNYWSSDEFTFQRPLHVHAPMGLKWDKNLVEVLLRPDTRVWLEAAIEFNHANTDSPDVPTYLEMIMVKSAFERLMGIKHRADEFARELIALAGPPTASNPAGPLNGTWISARNRSKRPLEAWAREFCDRRGTAAHGVERNGERFVWSEQAHLAFASILFPLIVKKLAAKRGEYSMTVTDDERLRRMDHYISYDPFLPAYNAINATHPWVAIDDACRAQALAGQFVRWQATG